MTTTQTTAPTTLTLTAAQWRALDTHKATERTRYAMEYAAWSPATDKARDWLASAGVVCATDGKRALYLPTEHAPAAVGLAAIPTVSKAKRAQSDAYPCALLADGTEGRHYPPVLDVIPSKGTGLEIPTDSLRALFAPFATDPDNDAVRCWFGLGIRCASRSAVTDVSVNATWSNAPSDDHDAIGLGAAYVLAVCDAADRLGASLVTVQATNHRSAVCFDLSGKALALVMPRFLS